MTFTWTLPIMWRELQGSWTLDCVTRIGDLLAEQPTGPGRIELEWHLGGYFEEPDWVGPGTPRRHGSRMEFLVGLPRALQDDDLESRILGFATTAVTMADERLQTAGVAFDRAGHDRAVEAVRVLITALPPASERHEPFRPTEDRWLRRQDVRAALVNGPIRYAAPRPGVALPRVTFEYETTAELDALFELEAAVDAALIDADLGSVDGNEVGQGAYTLFLDPKRGKRAETLSVVDRIATERGIRAR